MQLGAVIEVGRGVVLTRRVGTGMPASVPVAGPASDRRPAASTGGGRVGIMAARAPNARPRHGSPVRHRRRHLNHLIRCSTAPVREVRRARILLLAWKKTPNQTIAAMLGCAVATVRRTRRDWRARGMKALTDRPRSGRPRLHDLDVRLLIAATATSDPPDTESQWTHQGIAEHLAQTRRIRISASQAIDLFFQVEVAGQAPIGSPRHVQ
ncbi:helix-turn-helix domain-containing protein [Micromonospora sp. NPDC023633]|uniref:helix-turn-helix domain-containing protein n=1 Tax=Micromonospora sp. NPDC023633 TaxID=3154320 RepID=UPI0033F7CC29